MSNAEELEELHREVERTSEIVSKLGEKFYFFTKDIKTDAMMFILEEQLDMNEVAPYYRIRNKDEYLELDILGRNYEQNKAVIVVVRTDLKQEHIQELLEQLTELRKLTNKYDNMKLYGMIAGEQASDSVKQMILKQGFYLTIKQNDEFKLTVPQNFVAKAF